MAKKSGKHELARLRDTVEGLYVAIVMALILRAFLIEAFVIPTGSMANSLYGEHFELTCPCCGKRYAVGFQTNGVSSSVWVNNVLAGKLTRPPGARCPNCGFPYDSSATTQTAPPVRLMGGDRVVVLKYLYDFHEPQPWDVVVFRNPQNNRENYIKRLIGLPGETIQIVGGDVYVKATPDSPWKIRRKTPAAQSVMWLPMYDNDFPPNIELCRKEGVHPPGWRRGENGQLWALGDSSDPAETNVGVYGGRVLEFAGGETPASLDYDPGDPGFPGDNGFNPFNSYNTREAERPFMEPSKDICTDWRLSAVVQLPETDDGADADSRVKFVFDVFETRYAAAFYLSGKVTLARRSRGGGEWEMLGEAQTAPFVPGKGRKITFRKVDGRAEVLVDDRSLLHAETVDYKQAMHRATLSQQLAFEGKSSSKAGQLRKEINWAQKPGLQITACGKKLQLWHVNLQRDVYYVSPTLQVDKKEPQFDYFDKLFSAIASGTSSQGGVNRWAKEANGSYKGWGAQGNPIYLRTAPRDFSDSALDEFYCLGDNSLQSHDGRYWTAAAPSLRLYDDRKKPIYQMGTVPRYNMLGRAMLVFWAGGFDLPLLNWPLIPNTGRMRMIR